MSKMKKTAENLFDDLIKDTQEIPIDINVLSKTSTPRQKPKQGSGSQSSFVNFIEEHDPFSDDIMKQEKERKELKEKKEGEVKLKRLLKKCKKFRVRLLRLSKKQINILIKNSKINISAGKKVQEEKKRGRPNKRQASSAPSSPNNKRIKISPATLKTKGALKEMPKQKIFLKLDAITSPGSRSSIRRTLKPPEKYNTTPDVKKSPLKKKSSPKSKIEKKVTPKKQAHKITEQKKQKVTKTISKKMIEKKFGKVFLQCHVKVLRNKLDNLDSTHLLEKSFKESRKKQKCGAKKSVSFKETVSVDVYEPEPSSDFDIVNNDKNINGENVQNDINLNELDSVNPLNESLDSVQMANDDTSTKLNSEYSTPPRTRSPKTSYSPLKTDITPRSEILKKSDEKIAPLISITDSEEDDFVDATDGKIIDVNDGNEINENDDKKINETDDKKFNDNDDDNKINDIAIEDKKLDLVDEENKDLLHDNLNKECPNKIGTEKECTASGNDDPTIDSTESSSAERAQIHEKNKEDKIGSDYASDIDKSFTTISSQVRISENITDNSKKPETNTSDYKIANGKKNEDDLFGLIKVTKNKDNQYNNKDDDISYSGLDGELRLTPDEEKTTIVQTLPLTKPPKSVFASLYESIKSKLPGAAERGTPERDEDDESFDVPKVTGLQQFETDDESTLLGDPVLGGRDRDRDEIVF